MKLLDGRLTASVLKNQLKLDNAAWMESGGKKPHLVAVIVGDDPASKAYVASKERSCAEVGFASTLITKPESITEIELLDLMEELNADSEVDGLIVQLPLPKHIDEQKVILAINPAKDVDGFTPENFGRMAMGLPSYIPATPNGILLLLKHYEIATKGKHCVVLGRSHIVGLPISILMGRKTYPGNCTVTLAHSATEHLAELLRSADILIAAIGIPEYIHADMIKPGAVVIDVGINRVVDATSPRGFRLTGDVNFPAVAPFASYITPVPGGVGLMTVTSLLLNTFLAAQKAIYS